MEGGVGVPGPEQDTPLPTARSGAPAAATAKAKATAAAQASTAPHAGATSSSSSQSQGGPQTLANAAAKPPAARPQVERSARGVRRPGARQRLERNVTEFSGQAFTKVVAAEINAERRSREYVVFNIRVNDDAYEWTVLRRFRNFEQLHKRLRNAHGFSGSLPPKRYFFNNNSWELVEQRREQLDKYLHLILMDPVFCYTDEVFDFLNPWSSAYALDTDVSLLNVVSNNLDNARHSVVQKVPPPPASSLLSSLSLHFTFAPPPFHSPHYTHPSPSLCHTRTMEHNLPPNLGSCGSLRRPMWPHLCDEAETLIAFHAPLAVFLRSFLISAQLQNHQIPSSLC